MIEVVTGAFTFFGLLLASEVWRYAASDQVDSGQVPLFRILAVALEVLLVAGQSGWLARRRHAALRVVAPPALATALATFTSLWLVTRRGGRCDDCNLWVLFVLVPAAAAVAAAVIAFLVAGAVRALGGRPAA